VWILTEASSPRLDPRPRGAVHALLSTAHHHMQAGAMTLRKRDNILIYLLLSHSVKKPEIGAPFQIDCRRLLIASSGQTS
jgi:hypothetical protein